MLTGLPRGPGRERRALAAEAEGPVGQRARRQGVSLYDSTFSRTVWRLYGGAKGLVMWYYSVRSVDPDGTLHGVVGQPKHGRVLALGVKVILTPP